MLTVRRIHTTALTVLALVGLAAPALAQRTTYPTPAPAVHPWHGIASEATPGVVNVYVEIPKGDKRKFEIDKPTGALKIDRHLKGPDGYPLNYGFVPQTLWDDGDALDVVVLGGKRVKPGTLVRARVIGVMPTIDSGDLDDKVIAVDVTSKKYQDVVDLATLPPAVKASLVHFFTTYKIPDGKKVEVGAFKDAAAARETITKGQRIYAGHFFARSGVVAGHEPMPRAVVRAAVRRMQARGGARR